MPIWTWGWPAPTTVSPSDISILCKEKKKKKRKYFVIKTVQFQHSNFFKVDKIIYNSISDTCSIVIVHKLHMIWFVFEQKLCSNSTKCLVNVLKAAAFTASFSQCDVIESCVEILASMLNRVTKFKLIKLWQYMSLIEHWGNTRYGDICHT